MNAKKALAILLTAAQIIGAASLVGAAEFTEDELTAADVTIDAPEFGEVTEDFGGAEEIGLIAPGDEQERVWVRRIELNNGEVDLLPNQNWTLYATVTPRYADDTSIHWWSEDENIVTVTPLDEAGHEVLIETHLNKGDVWVHCEANDRPGVSADCLFRVQFDEDGHPGGWEDYSSWGNHNYSNPPN